MLPFFISSICTDLYFGVKININAFTVPAGQTFTLDAPSGATVNLLGDVTVCSEACAEVMILIFAEQFGVAAWAGPLFQLTGTGVTCKTFRFDYTREVTELIIFDS